MADTLTLLSPEVITFSHTSIQAKISHEVFTESKFGVKTPVNHSVLIVSEKSADDKFDLPLDQQVLFGKELIGQLSGIKSVVGNCSQLAERLFGQLKSLNGRLKGIPELEEYFAEYKERYEKLDFMGHRQILGNIMKSKKNECINKAVEIFDPKSVRVALETFIIDRNKYTHGDLVYWQNEKLTLLEYINNVNYKPEYAIVNSEILNSFIECYNMLTKIFSNISACLG
jgi:hypothetical protein